ILDKIYTWQQCWAWVIPCELCSFRINMPVPELSVLSLSSAISSYVERYGFWLFSDSSSNVKKRQAIEMSTPVKKVPIHLQSSQNRLHIKNGKVVNEDDITEEDVYIEDGVIKQVGKNLTIPGGTRVIDARGRYVLPGGIDPHTHFEFEFMGTKSVDDFYQGTKAAIAGGTTMIIIKYLKLSQYIPAAHDSTSYFQEKGESLTDAYYEYRQKADGKVCCDYGLHVCLPHWSEQVKKEMEILTKEHGVNSFKMFMAYDFMLNDAELYSAFDQCQKLGAIAQVHAENGHVIKKNAEKLLAKGITGPEGHEMSRPEEVEAEAVNRACVIAKQVDCPLYVVHVMSKSAAQALDQACERGTRVYGETLAAALGTDGTHYKNSCFHHSAGHILSPPLRPDPQTPFILMNSLAQYRMVNAPLYLAHITTENSAEIISAKRSDGQKVYGEVEASAIGITGQPNNANMITSPPIRSNSDSFRLLAFLSSFVAVTSTNAAKIFNIYPRKGCIAVGSDADVVIWNPLAIRTISANTHHQAADFNIFEGMQCHGIPEYVIVNGRVCVDEGQLRVAEGHGRFVETPVFAPYIYDPEKLESLKYEKNGVSDEIDHLKINKVHLDDDPCPTPTLPESIVGTPSCRGPRPEGQRNIQKSTFSVSEEMDTERKSSIRVRNPPGGKSSGFW
ncbi:hypothetical protein NQ317_002381, partial [Molorchus minor]